jgi:nucleoside-diphosphate-sugar epimerase
MRYEALVTGGAGFIGSHLVESLVRGGAGVRVFDNLSTGSRENLASIAGDCRLIEGDVRDADAIAGACRGVEVVFHLAAYISVPGSVADPRLADGVNIGGTLNTLIAARDAGVRRVVFSSSAAVYGEPEIVPTPESCPPRPGSPYGIEKLYGEHTARVFSELFGLETVSLRYFNVYGARQRPDSEYAAVIPKFAQALAAGRSATIFGDGGQTRDFLSAADVARANILAADATRVVGLSINVASGKAVSVLDLYEQMGALCGSEVAPTFAPARHGDVRLSCADVRLANEALGFAAGVSLADGLVTSMSWMRDHEARRLHACAAKVV